jgi:hypothetical protein
MAAAIFGRVFAGLEAKGTPIGASGTLIARRRLTTLSRRPASTIHSSLDTPSSGALKIPLRPAAMMRQAVACSFVEFDAHADTAVLTMRSGSYEGPIIFGTFADGFSEAAKAQTWFGIGHTAVTDTLALTIDDVYVDQYAP